jgi:hypothetical protein
MGSSTLTGTSWCSGAMTSLIAGLVLICAAQIATARSRMLMCSPSIATITGARPVAVSAIVPAVRLNNDGTVRLAELEQRSDGTPLG